MKISDRHLLSNSPRIRCHNRPLVAYLKDDNSTYYLISANGTVTPVPILEDTATDLPAFQTTRLHGYDDRLLTHSPDKLELYTMLEIFSIVHDAIQELKDLQIDNGDGDTLLGIGRALGATLQSAAQGGSSIIRATGGAIHDTLNGVRNLDEKVVGSLGEAASKVIQSTGHAVKYSTTGVGNMFHGILGGIGGTIHWCFILVILLVLFYINRSTVLKLCRRKTSGPSNAPTPPPSTLSIDPNHAQKEVNNPLSTPEQPPPTLPLVLASFSLHDLSLSQERSGVVIPITISSQNDHISCSALVNTGSPVTLLSETLQHQLNLPATPL